MERVFLWRLEARVWSGQRDGWGCLFGVELAGGEGCLDKVCYWHSYKNWRLRARPRLFPTRSTFFSAGMRHEHLLQAQTYNLGLSGPLSSRIQWSAGPFSAPPHRQRDTCTRIPSTHPCPRRRIACRGSGVGWGSVAALHCPDWKLR